MLKEGMKLKKEKTVQPEESANKFASGTLDVFATPAMIGLIENTAQKCVQPHLEEENSTVGVHVDVKHLKATPIGMKVKCEATLTAIEGKKLKFEVEAWDEKGKIGEGTHTRYIINSEKFMENL